MIALAATAYAFGVAPSESALYLGYSLLYTLLPGLCLYSLLARPVMHPVSLVVRAWGFGLVLEMLTYVGLGMIGAQRQIVFYPIPFVILAILKRKSIAASIADRGEYPRRVLAVAWVVVLVLSALAAAATFRPQLDNHFM